MKTPSQTVGPFYDIGLGRRDDSHLVPHDDPDAMQLIGALLDGQGTPIGDGMIELWDGRRWARSATGSEGRFRSRSRSRRPGPERRPASTSTSSHAACSVTS